MRVCANQNFAGRLPPNLEALITCVIWPPQFGVTTGLNWDLNRQPLCGNTSTASSNKATISAAHSHTASRLGIIISTCYERRDPAFSPKHRKNVRGSEAYFDYN